MLIVECVVVCVEVESVLVEPRLSLLELVVALVLPPRADEHEVGVSILIADY